MTAGTHDTRRLDIEGLRAVAIVLVLLYHAGLPLTGGYIGVDVFFVISGFLITGLLLREIEATHRLSLARFYARRAKRLLPAAGVVLVATVVLTWVSASAVTWRTFGWDIVGAATYVVNWVLAGRQVDYLAEDVGASPVQHFWSLAIEEQFYILLPLLLLLVAWVVRTRSRSGRVRPWALAAVLAIALPSLAWSIHFTALQPGQAFFVTTTRLWELAVGAIVAIGSRTWPALTRVPAELLAWAGMGLIVVGALGFDATTPWPSAWALLPTGGTALVIIAGFQPTTWSRWLSVRPAVWIGALSYSLYLWHWPLLETARATLGELPVPTAVAVSVASFLPAYLSYRFIENPIRSAPALGTSNRLALSVGLNFSLAGAAAGLLLIAATLTTPGVGRAPPEPLAEGEGAGAIDPAATPENQGEDEGFTPLPIDATEDLPAAYDDGCQVDQESPVPLLCEFGDLDGETQIAVVGDSKVIQYQSALDAIGMEHGIHFFSYTKSACAMSAGVQEIRGEPYDSCAEWNEQVMADVTALGPDAVLTSGRAASALADPADPDSETRAAMQQGIIGAWSELAEAGIPVIGILDNPTPDLTVYECVADAARLTDCAFEKSAAIERSSAGLYRTAHARVAGSALVDIRHYICPGATCPPVIGNVLVYRQGSHLTDTYVRTLTPVLAEALLGALADVESV